MQNFTLEIRGQRTLAILVILKSNVSRKNQGQLNHFAIDYGRTDMQRKLQAI